MAFLILHFTRLENFSPGKCSVDGLTAWKRETISQPLSEPHLQTSQIKSNTTYCSLTPSLSGIYHQVFSSMPNVKCVCLSILAYASSLFPMAPSGSSCELLNRLVELKVSISNWEWGWRRVAQQVYPYLSCAFPRSLALTSGDLLFCAPCCIRSTSNTACHAA